MMKEGSKLIGKDALFTLIVLVVAFCLNMLMQQLFDTQTLIPMICERH